MINKKVRAFSASDREIKMLESLAEYHGTNKSATLAGLIKKEFWRIFPNGRGSIKRDRAAQVRVASIANRAKE